MTSQEVISILRENGWTFHHATGSHHIFKHPSKPGHVTVPHPRKDMAKPTIKVLNGKAV